MKELTVLPRVGGTSLYKLYRYVPSQRVGFLRCFGLKTGIHFSHFGLESSMIFRGNYGSIWTYLSFQFQMSKNEREICEFEMGLKNFFCLRSNLSNDDIISAWRPDLKTVVENDIFWSEIKSGFGEPGGTSLPRIPRSTPGRFTKE